MATATKKKRKEEAYPWKAGTSSGHTTNLKQSILRLSISMGLSLKKSKQQSPCSNIIMAQCMQYVHCIKL
jgi:hypothetical protein